jgi:hypothetical protein
MTTPELTTQPNRQKDFYFLIVAILPIAAFICLYHIPENWSIVELISDTDKTGTGGFLYSFMSFTGFFVAGIFGLIFVQVSPYPKSALLGFIMLIDTPIELALVKILGSDLSIDQLIIIDFFIETLGLVLACAVLLTVLNKRIHSDNKTLFMILVIQGALLVFGFYGYLSYQWIKELSFMNQLPFYIGVVGTVSLYFAAFKKQDEEKRDMKSKNFSAKVATIGILVCWVYLVIALVDLNS